MQLYYTGAKAPEAVQINPELSLGGYKSSTLISNGDISNIFPTITKAAIIQNKKDIRMIVLKNTTAAAIEGLKIWTISEKYSKVKIAAVAPATDTAGNKVFESVTDSHSIPYQATLESCEGEVNASEIGSLSIGAIIGIWVQRELDQTKFSNSDKGLAPDLSTLEKADAYIAEITSSTEEEDEIKVLFSWD